MKKRKKNINYDKNIFDIYDIYNAEFRDLDSAFDDFDVDFDDLFQDNQDMYLLSVLINV